MISKRQLLDEIERLQSIKRSETMSENTVIAEIEQISGPVKIVISRNGNVSVTPLPDSKNVVWEDLKMPCKKFWDNLSALVKSMHEEIESKKADFNKLKQEIDDFIKIKKVCEIKEIKKIVPVNSNKKQMFIAGLTFGKNLNKGK